MLEVPSITLAKPIQGLALDTRQRRMLQAMGISGLDWIVPKQAEKVVLEEKSAQNEEKLAEKTDFLVPKSMKTPVDIAQAATKIIVSETPVLTFKKLQNRIEGIENMDWAALQTAVSGCQACGLCQSRKNTVFGVGNTQADWLIVGEAPGENEDIVGEPFVGQAGKLLDNMLATMTLSRSGTESKPSNVYIANVLKCRPPANRNPAPEEIALCEAYLARQIELLQPKMILAMGKFAIATLTGKDEPVGKMRGKMHELRLTSLKTPVIVTYHPAYLLRNLPAKAQAWADLRLAMTTLTTLAQSK